MKNKYKKIIILLICELISLSILFFNESVVKEFSNVIYILLLTIGVTLSTNSVAAFISDRFKDNELCEIAKQNFSVLKYCQEYGLTGIYKDFPLDDEKFKNEFVNSKNFYLVMNDGKNFISNHKELLEKRLQLKYHSTHIIIQDYNQVDVMNALTRKNGHEGDYYENKIKNLINYDIKNLKLKCNDKHNFSLYLNPNYNTLAIIVTDNYAMISIYRVAPGKNQVPHFVFAKGSTEYNYIEQDVKNIIQISNLVQ
jgi:membrane protein